MPVSKWLLIAAATAMSATAMSASSAQELTGTLKKIKETGTITMGYRESSVPFSYLDDNQKPTGFAIDICMKIVEDIKSSLKLEKLNVATVPVTSATRIPLMANGTIDLECGSTTNNPDRQKQVSFTNSHYLTATRFLSKKTSGLKSIADLKGKTVVSTSGTTNIKQLNEANTARGLGMNIIAAKDHAEAFLILETDRAVAFVMDDVVLASIAAGSKEPTAYVVSEDAFSKPEPYGIMMRRDDPAFKAAVDASTAALYKSPAMTQLYVKWFESPIPPKGLNLATPMNESIRKLFASPSDSGDPNAY